MGKKRGLGKSLDALLIGSGISYENTIEQESDEIITQLPVVAIQSGRYQPRKQINEQALAELAVSIGEQGVIQPIVVRRIADDKYEIIAGERRWRASKLASCDTVPAIVREIPDEAAMAVALIENIQRENLNPIEESMALHRLLEEFSLTHQQVADKVGKSRTTVTNLLRLRTLCEDVRNLLLDSSIEMGHARALLALPQGLQLKAATEIINAKLSVREAEKLVRSLLVKKYDKSLSRAIDPDVYKLQKDLSTRLGLTVAIKYNSKGKGNIVINYNNLVELESILEYFQTEQAN